MNNMTRHDWEMYCEIKHFSRDRAESFKRIRRNERKLCQNSEPKWKTIWYDKNGEPDYIEKRFYDFKFTPKEWEEYVDQHWVRSSYPMYDCTGEWLSSGLYKYEVPNGTWVYHRLAMNI